jgi:lipid II:glycine glycyltransferase (peptidoglycan interpeptide bridge formation enzyme)
MIKLGKNVQKQLIETCNKSGVCLEGNIIKLIDAEGDDNFIEYLKEASEKDKTSRRKRLEITKQIQSQNKELTTAQEANMKLMEDLRVALEASTNAKEAAEADLDLLQKKTQTELIGTIVKVALWIVVGIGVVTTILYGTALMLGANTTLLGNAWSNMFGILLTNSFSIIGTIMGVKYATEK